MTRLKLFLLLAASGSAVALLVFPATLSAANGKPTIVAITNAQQSFDAPAGRACSGFELRVTPVSNNQTVKVFPPDQNGDVREIITGTLKGQLMNVDTGKSIIANTSDPATEIVHPDGSGRYTISGKVVVSYWAPFNPIGPATYLYTGHTVLSFDDDGTLTLVSTTDKSPFDVCAALS